MSIISSKFLPQIRDKPGLQVATVAAGCFWGTEHMYRKYFLNKGLIDTSVGYSGGDKENPSYKEVCSTRTNHAEALQILYDPEHLSFDTIIDFFFKMHDPTTANRQGPDVGSQYRSAIFTENDQQQRIAQDIKNRFQKEFWKDEIKTTISPIKNWWDAETYHQLYLEKNPMGYECPTHYLRTKPQV